MSSFILKLLFFVHLLLLGEIFTPKQFHFLIGHPFRPKRTHKFNFIPVRVRWRGWKKWTHLRFKRETFRRWMRIEKIQLSKRWVSELTNFALPPHQVNIFPPNVTSNLTALADESKCNQSSNLRPQEECPKTCLGFQDPVCGDDGKIYPNKCLMEKRNCGRLDWTSLWTRN